MKTEQLTALDIERNIGNFAYPDTHTPRRRRRSEREDDSLHLRRETRSGLGAGISAQGAANFLSKPMPTHWASKDLEAIDFDKIRYYLSGGTQPKRNWEDVPEDVKRTFERLGIPEQERKFLAGVEAQFDSEAVYSNIKKAVGEQGVIFVGIDRRIEGASGNFPEMVRQSHPDRRQQIQRAELRRFQRRLVHLRAAGRESETSAPGLLPDQRRELRAVRAHAHHLR